MTPDKTMDVKKLAEKDSKTLADECTRLRAEMREWKRLAWICVAIIIFLVLMARTR